MGGVTTPGAFLSRSTTAFRWLILISLETLGQLSLKFAADGTDVSDSLGPWLQKLALNHWFQISIACDIAGFLAWMSILRRHDLSFAIPISGLCYFATVGISTIFLHEPVQSVQLIGLAIIGTGVILVAAE